MSRTICIQPCLPTNLPPSIHLPMGSGASIQGASNMTLKTGCSGCELVGNLMIQIQPLLGGLGPILGILGCLGAVIKAVKAVPDSLGPPPDPTKLIGAITQVVAKCEPIVSSALPPPVGVICSFLLLLRDILGTLLSIIKCVTGLVQHLVVLNLKTVPLLGSKTPSVLAAANCAAGQVQTLTKVLAGKMGAVTTLADAVGSLLSILTVVPGLGSVASDLATALNVFSTSLASPTLDPGGFLTALQTLQSSITTIYNVVNTAAAICPQ